MCSGGAWLAESCPEGWSRLASQIFPMLCRVLVGEMGRLLYTEGSDASRRVERAVLGAAARAKAAL